MAIDFGQLAQVLGQNISAAPFAPLMSAQNPLGGLQGDFGLPELAQNRNDPIGVLAAGQPQGQAQSPFGILAAASQQAQNPGDPLPEDTPAPAETPEERQKREMEEKLKAIQGEVPAPPPIPPVDPNFTGAGGTAGSVGNAQQVANIMAQLFGSGGAAQSAPQLGLAQLLGGR